jgi:microcystin-dependent protein
MPTIYERDPVSKTLVPVIGGMTQSDADAKFLRASGGTITGTFTVPTPQVNYGDMDYAVVPKSYVDDTLVGLVLPYAGSSAPSGWLLCQGQAISRTTYAALYALCGTTYGVGDGSTTFNIPDLRGRLPVGIGSSGYFDARGEKQGAKTVTLAKSQVPNFSGQWEMHNAAGRTMIYHVTGSIASNMTPSAYATGYQNSGAASIGYANLNMGFGGGAHNNITWSFTLNFIVRT